MDNNNDFLNSYKKKDGAEAPEMKYEEKATFKKPPENKPQRDYSPRKKRNATPIILVILAIILIIIAIWLILFFGRTVTPSFNGWSKNDFLLWASENDVLTQVDEVYNDDHAANTIYEQLTPEGERIKKGDALKVVVSLGPDPSVIVPLPDLMSMTKSEIEDWEESNHLSKVRYAFEFNDTVPNNSVIKYVIGEDGYTTDIRRDTILYIYISKGIEDTTVEEIEVPDFKLIGITEAIIFGQDKGITITINEVYDDYVPDNMLISQSVAVGDKVKPGDEIVLVISKGQKILMPSFSGLSKEQAMSEAGKLGLSVSMVDRYSSVKEGSFVWQNIEVGTEITQDTAIELCYSLGNKIPISSFVGMQLNQLEQFVDGINKDGAKIYISKTYTQSQSPEGTILQQDRADEYLNIGNSIKVVVSSGIVLFMPDFVANEGATYADAITRDIAQRMCDELNITCVFIEESNPDRLPGEIWHQDIPAATEVGQGTRVTLKYNPVNSSINMPDFVGLTRTEVEALPEYLLLNITFISAPPSDPSLSNKVMEQSVMQNTIVPPGTEVTLTIAEQATAQVPNLVAAAGSQPSDIIDMLSAQSLCDAAGITIVFVHEINPDRLPGEVWEQSLTAGSTVDHGAVITVKYNDAEQCVSVPDMIGKTEAEITAEGHTDFNIIYVTGTSNDPNHASVCYEQSLTAGTTVEKGLGLTVTIGPTP